MIEVSQIEKLIEPGLAQGDYFVVSLDVKPGNIIQLELDSDAGVTVDDLIKFSRLVEHSLDRDEEDFELKVSSPGADQPIVHWRQYKKLIGKDLKVRSADDKVSKGTLVEVDEKGLTIEHKYKERLEGRKKKVEKVDALHFDHENIKESKVILAF